MPPQKRPNRIPSGQEDEDRALRMQFLNVLCDGLGSQAAAARCFGVGEPAISQWLSGKREVEEWPVLIRAFASALRRTAETPEVQADLIQRFAAELLEHRGTWVPDDPNGEERVFEEELMDVTVAQGRVVHARQSGDPEAAEEANRHLVRQVVELASVPPPVRLFEEGEGGAVVRKVSR